MSFVLGLIALALGYLVFVSASKEKEGIKLLGQVIGILVMILALFSAMCASMKCAYKYKSNCPVAAKGYCPMKSGGNSQQGPVAN